MKHLTIPFTPEDIKGEANVIKFIMWLKVNDLLYHPEEDARDIKRNGHYLFTKEQGYLINAIMDKCFQFVDPCEIVLTYSY